MKTMSTARVVMKMVQVRGTEYLDAARIEAMQRKRLRRLLAHVLSHSRFYAEYYRDHGITLDRLPEVQLTDLPPINKDLVMANFDALVCDPAVTRAGVEQFLHESSNYRALYQNRCHVAHTSGSSGSPGIFLYGRRDWDLLQALVGARVICYRPTLGRIRYAYIVKTDGHHGGVKLCQGAPWIAFKQMALSINAPLDRTLRDLDSFRPELLAGYGSGLMVLAQQQLAMGTQIRPRRIVSSGDSLTEEMKRTIQDAFGIPPIDLYASCESLAMGVSCRHNRGIHLFEDWHCFEIIGRDGKPASPGSYGRVRLTTLYNYTQPLIRYDTSDETSLVAGRCPCGWPFRMVEGIAGRTEETLWFARDAGEKECVHPSTFATLHVPGVERWQFVQTAPNELLVRIKTTADPATVVRGVREQVMTFLRPKQLEPFLTVCVEIVGDIPNDPVTGKYRLIIPYRSGGQVPIPSPENAVRIHSTRTSENQLA